MAAKSPDAEALGARPSPHPAGGLSQYRGEVEGREKPAQALFGFAEDQRSAAQTTIAAGQTDMATGAEFMQMAQIFRAEQEKMDTVRVEDAWNQYKNAALDVTNGQKGVLNLKGGDAVNGNILQSAETNLQSAKDRILEGLANDAQRARFKARADSTDLQVKHQVLTHLEVEGREYAKSVIMGSEAAAKGQITAAPASQDVFMQAKDTLMRQADVFLKGQGITDPDAVKAYKDKVTDSLWMSRIDALLYSQPVLAEALFRANEKEIKNPELRLQLQNKTREVATGVSATIEAQKVIDEVRSKMTATAAVGTIEDGPAAGPRSTSNGIDGLSKEKVPGGVSYSFRTPTGTYVSGTAPSEYEAARRMRLGSGTAEMRNVALKTDEALAPATNGLPNSRDIAAQLPFMLLRVEKVADAKYGPDQGNPDRAAFIRRMTSELHSKVAADVQQLNAIQRQNQGLLIDAITGVLPTQTGQGGTMPAGGRAGTPGQVITSFSQIQANPTLLAAWQMTDAQAKLGLERLIEHNQRAQGGGDEALYWETWKRIHLPTGDPNKVDFYQQIIDLAGPGKLDTKQIGQLRLEIDRAETPGGRSVGQMRKAADAQVSNYFKTNVMFTAQPDRQIAATMRWNEDTGKKIDAYIAAGQPDKVRAMFQLDTPESVVNPTYLQSYVTSTPAQGLAAGAAAARAGTPPAAAPATPKTEAEYNALPPGTVYIDPKGVQRQKPGTPATGTFNPEGAEYDMESAKRAGLKADETGHWPSRDPQTGLLLKGRGHETWAKTIEGERAAGMEIYKGPDNRYYSRPAQVMDATGKLVPNPVPPAPPAKPKGELPTFGGSINDKSPEYLAQHVTEIDRGAAKHAIKETGKAALNVMGSARAVMDAYFAGVEKLRELPAAARRESARAYFEDILKKPQFFKEDVPAIQEAMKYGDLSVADRKKAKALLKAAGVE